MCAKNKKRKRVKIRLLARRTISHQYPPESILQVLCLNIINCLWEKIIVLLKKEAVAYSNACLYKNEIHL